MSLLGKPYLFIKKVYNYAVFRIRTALREDPDRFLKKVKGIIHVGANTGQEMELYAKYKLPVVWIEPIPEVFETLQNNLKAVKNQVAIKGLVTDVDDNDYEFHVANNYGASSSILELDLHTDIWPDIKYEKTISLKSNTLASLLKNNNISLDNFDTLIMDTQGSELLVLQGSVPILDKFTFIKTEVSDFESYKGCCQLKDIDAFLREYGFKEYYRHKFIEHPKGGSYFDIVYKK